MLLINYLRGCILMCVPNFVKMFIIWILVTFLKRPLFWISDLLNGIIICFYAEEEINMLPFFRRNRSTLEDIYIQNLNDVKKYKKSTPLENRSQEDLKLDTTKFKDSQNPYSQQQNTTRIVSDKQKNQMVVKKSLVRSKVESGTPNQRNSAVKQNKKELLENYDRQIKNGENKIIAKGNTQTKGLHKTPSKENIVKTNPTDKVKEVKPVESYKNKMLQKIRNVNKDVRDIEKQVKTFSGTKKDKTFLHLKELLILNVLKLDNIESEGHMDIRKERKDVIKYAHDVLNNLTSKTS